jgi:EmrB/QacA subfamily drug resistance transporter
MMKQSALRVSTPESISARITNKWIVLSLVCMAEFMVVLDATVVTVALPSIQRGLRFSAADLQWIVNAYALTFGGFLLLGGRLGDLIGRRRVFLVGLALFTAASIFNGLASSPAMLIIGRGAQGLGGALITPTALAIIVGSFPRGAKRTRALGIWSGIVASGGAVGLLVGGALTQAINWRWAFFINGPVGVIVWLLAARLIAESKSLTARSVDLLGASTATAGLIAITYALVTAAQPGSHGSTSGWTATSVIVWGGIGTLLLAVFVVIESRSRHPLVPLSIFRVRPVSSANLAMFLIAGGTSVMFYYLTLYMQQALRYEPFRAGLAFLPVPIAIAAGAGLASMVIKRTDARVVACFGLVLAAFGLLWLTQTSLQSGYAGSLLGPMIVMSVGVALAWVPLTLIAMSHIGAGDAGLASGLLQTSQRVGGTLGLALLVTLSTSQTTTYLRDHPLDPSGALVSGFHAGYLGGAAFIIAAAIVVALFIRRPDVAELGGLSTEAMVGISDDQWSEASRPTNRGLPLSTAAGAAPIVGTDKPVA